MHDAIPPGINCRIGVSVLTPPKVADLIGVKERKYLDLIARVRHRNIGDLMRYVQFRARREGVFRRADGSSWGSHAEGGHNVIAIVTNKPLHLPCISTRSSRRLTLTRSTPRQHLGKRSSSGRVARFATRRRCIRITSSRLPAIFSRRPITASSTMSWMSGLAPIHGRRCFRCGARAITKYLR